MNLNNKNYFGVPGPIANNTAYSNVDYWYGPYPSIEDACDAIPEGLRKLGLTVGIIEDGKVVEYLWKLEDVSNENLVPKIEAIIATADLIAPEILNYAESPGMIEFLVNYQGKIGGRITIFRNGAEIDHLNIISGINTYSVGVPSSDNNYDYSITIKDLIGLDVVISPNSFTIRVGVIKITTNLLDLLNKSILGNSINTYIDVKNSGKPCHLYLISEDEGILLITGTRFASYLLNIPLSQISGDHYFYLKAYSLTDSGGENSEEVDQIKFTYTRLTEGENPYKIVIDNVTNVSTVEKVTVAFHYQAYDSVLKQVEFIIDDDISHSTIPETYFAAFDDCRYNLNPISQVGTHTLKLRIENIESELITFSISLYEIDENIIPGALFLFDSIQSEESNGYALSYSGINSGINGVDLENKLIKFSGESYAKLKYLGEDVNPFSLNLSDGATLELVYNTKCIGNLKAPVLTTFLNETDNSFGVEITYLHIAIGLNGSYRYTVDVSENTWIHASIVFSTRNFNDSNNEIIHGDYMYVYINGCLVLVQPLTDGLPEFNRNACLTINTDNSLENFGECNIRLLRFYNSPLSPSQIVLNYINSITDPDEKVLVRGKNLADLPTITFTEKPDSEYHFSHLLALTDKSLLKVLLVKCSTEYLENSTSEPIIWEYTTVATLGTSTLLFPIKNFKIKIYNDGDYEKKGKPDTFNGTTIKELGKNKKYVLFKSEEGWDKENVFTLKCDYMESAHLNNTPTCKFFNNMIDALIEDNINFSEWNYDSVSPARAGYIDNLGLYRVYNSGQDEKRGYLDAIKGFPCIVKYVDESNVEHYLGTFMFNLDKEASSLGFEVYNKIEVGENEYEYQKSECVSLEGKSNTDEGAGSFCSFDYWLTNKSGVTVTVEDGETIYNYDPNQGYYASEYNNFYLNVKNILPHNLSFNDFILYFLVDHEGEDFYSEAGSMNKRHLISANNQDSYYNLDFETRYIYNEDYETSPTNWKNWITIVDFISHSYEIVTDSQNPVTNQLKADIKVQFELYFSLNYCLLYYLQMVTFALVDNAGKNCMWDTWDGVKWYPRPYDLDTMAGLDNSGLEIIDPDVEYNMEGSPRDWFKSSASLSGANILSDFDLAELDRRRYERFNTRGSRMWVLFKILYDTEIKTLYAKLRNKGIYNANNIIDFYFSQTSDIIGETYYNKDAINKFIHPLGPLNQTLYLGLLHGNRRERFKYWITTRLKFCDSLFEYNRLESELINLRINPSSISDLIFKVYNPIYILITVGTNTGANLEADAEYNFYCSPNSLYEDGKEGVKISIPKTSGDKEVAIYGAKSIKEIEGLSNLNCKLINLSRAEKITTLELFGLRNLTSLVLGNNIYLLTLVAEGLTGITNELDLRNASNIKKISLRSSTFNNLYLTTEVTGTTAKIVDISNTAIQNLSIRLAPFLQTLNVNGCSLLLSLILNNCNIENLAFSSLPSLKTLNLVECSNLRSVNISELSYFELDTLNFYNCPNLLEIIMTGVFNVNLNIRSLSLESIVSLLTLDLRDTLGIELIYFDTTRLQTLKSLNIKNSLIIRLDLPPQSELTTLNCENCKDLSTITDLNASLSSPRVFTNCKNLTSISGPQLKNTTALYMFLGCEKLNELNIQNIDFTLSSNFVGTFARCYSLPWADSKRVLTSTQNNIDASHVFFNRYSKTSNLLIIPANIFDNLPHISKLLAAFGYGLYGTSSIYEAGFDSVTTLTLNGYEKIKAINTFNNNLDDLTDILYLFYLSSITSIPQGFFAKFPNITNASGACASCSKLTTIPSDIFLTNTKLTNLRGCFRSCTGITSNISNILDPLVLLTDAAGLFFESGIRGTIPRGFLRNNKNLITANLMFAKSKITGLNPLFLDDLNNANGPYSLITINSMFADNPNLEGNIPENLFAGCTNSSEEYTITSAGSSYETIMNTLVTLYGLFYNTNIENVPVQLFDQLSNITTALGMFFNCKFASFPKSEVGNYNSIYTFLGDYLSKVTNINLMFAGCEGFSGSISEDFIPATVTEMNGTFAFSNIENIISLKNIPDLTTAIGAWAHTKVADFPKDLETGKINLFEGLSKLKNTSHFFRGCIYFDDLLTPDLFKDCVSLTNTSYMFSHCVDLGSSANDSTLLSKLFKNNLNLQDTSHMFEFCINLNGIIGDIFDTAEEVELEVTTSNYLYLTKIDGMFYRANASTTEGKSFSNVLFLYLTNVTSAEDLFAGFNNTPGRSNPSSSTTFTLYETDPLIKSPNLRSVKLIFGYANLAGTIDQNLFRPALSSLENLEAAFHHTKIIGVAGGFLMPLSGKNQKLSNVSNAFKSIPTLTSDVPLCNDKTKFTNIKNAVDTYLGYVADSSSISNISQFIGQWIDGSKATPLGSNSYIVDTLFETYSLTKKSQLGL